MNVETLKAVVDYGIPIIALVLSAISLVKSIRGQKLQDRINEIEIKLKEYELLELEKKQNETKVQCVEARVVRISSDNYRMKIWNSGNSRVYNVSAKVEEGSNLILYDSKMPFDYLDPGKNFEEPVIVYLGSADKFKIITFWEDEDGNKHQKEQMGSI